MKIILAIFIPAMLTNIATPIWSSYMMKNLAEYWDDAVAGMAVIWRLLPILFVYVFAMSWSIWSIVGQNYWAELYDRVYETIKKSILMASWYVVIAVILLIAFNGMIISAFNLQWDWAELLIFYSYFLAIFFIFNAVLFVGNATFNVIWKAYLSTITNILKSLVFLIPLVYVFSQEFWMKGILIAEAISILLTWIITLIFLKIYLPKHNINNW
jgi:Na+-driven multidrug efflux pump